VSANNTEEELDLLLVEKADAFAEKAHLGHTRSNVARDPYINHLREVAGLVTSSGGSTVEVCAALLHDSVEDTQTTLEDVEKNFGEEVAMIVEALTDTDEANMLPLLERKTLQAEHMENASNSIKRVKMADQISNIRMNTYDQPENWDEEKCIEYIEGARRVATVCLGVSDFLDACFKEVYKDAAGKYGFKEL
jgi:guanosine-3',5'-bis(diphosphate) 3'-pyrophosphohydrolase